jgi:hypothetical protein
MRATRSVPAAVAACAPLGGVGSCSARLRVGCLPNELQAYDIFKFLRRGFSEEKVWKQCFPRDRVGELAPGPTPRLLQPRQSPNARYAFALCPDLPNSRTRGCSMWQLLGRGAERGGAALSRPSADLVAAGDRRDA